jgi:hypothetical protein
LSRNPNRHWHSSRDENEPAIIAELEAADLHVVKLSSSAMTGLPDLLVGWQGHLAFVEVKMPGQKLREAQRLFQQKCQDRGTRYFIADDIDDALFIASCLKSLSRPSP